MKKEVSEMTKPRREFTAEFKAQVVLELLSGKKTVAELSREHEVKDSLIYTYYSIRPL